MTDRPGMRMVWHNPAPAYETIVVDDEVVIARKGSVVGLDGNGRDRWERSFDRQPHDLTPCGHHVAFAMASRWAATQIAALALDGRDAWRYDREWGLISSGIVGDSRGLVLSGHDYGPVADNHWVGLDERGAVTFDLKAAAHMSLTIAGTWLLADIDGRNGGVLRLDRDGTHPTTLTPLAHIGQGASDEMLILIESVDDAPADAVAFDLASGRERWRAPGGNVLDISIRDGHAAWVDHDRRPVVHEIASGRQVWVGAPLPPILDLSVYDCVLAPRMLVCIADDDVIYYSLDAAAPLLTRNAPGNIPDLVVWRDHLLESAGGLTCWEIT